MEASTSAFELPHGFGPLSWAEEDLCKAAATGATVSPRDPRMTWAHPAARVRAGLLRHLATQQEPARRVHERGFALSGLRVLGLLDLADCEVLRPLRFIGCALDEVDIQDARLATLTFREGWVDRIKGDRCTLKALFLRGVTVGGGVRLLGAQIAGDLDCSKASLRAPRLSSTDPDDKVAGNAALGLDGATIGGAWFMRQTRVLGSVVANGIGVAKLFDATGLFICSGQLALASAVLGGDMVLCGAAIRTEAPWAPSPYPSALRLGQARIAGSLLLSELFQADAPVDLSDAHVAGNLSLRAALFMGTGPSAIDAQRLQVEGALELDSRTCFGAEASARAVDKLPLLAGPLEPGGDDEQPLPPWRAGAALDLSAATVGALSDQWAHWPRGNRLLGFRYKEIVGATATRAAWWTRWLRLQVEEDLRRVAPGPAVLGDPGFKPQPWDQAILALRAAGCLREAEDLAIAKEREARRFDHGRAHPLHQLWGVCAGYGYRPLRLLWALPVVYLASVGVFSAAADAGAMAPTKEELLAKAEYRHCRPEAGGNWTQCALAPAYPDFNAWAYGLQMLLPALELRQAKDWAPVQWRRPLVTPAAVASGAAAAGTRTSSAPASASSSTSTSAIPPAADGPDTLPAVAAWGRGALYWSWCEAALGLAAPVLLGLALSGLIRRKLQD